MNQVIKHFFSALIFIAITGFFLPVMGQTDSTLYQKDTAEMTRDSSAVYYYTGTLHHYKNDQLYYIDTTLTYFHQYNPIQKGNKMYATLGNIGTASYNLVFSPDTTSGYNVLPLSLEPILITNSKVKYYLLNNPFTQLYYVMGPKREQNLAITFTRRLGKQLTVGMRMSLINSPGTYYHNFSDNRNVYFTTQYLSKNGRYGVIANYIYNFDRVQENGGIVNDSVFQLHQETDPKTIPVWLQSAENKIKTNGIFVQQYFNLLKPNHSKKERKVDAGNISYAFQYSSNKMVYTDNISDSTYYEPFPAVYDTLNTNDSLEITYIRNTIQWSNLGYNEDKLSQVFHLYGGVTFNHIKRTLPYDSVLQTQNQIIPYGGISLELFQRSHLTASGKYYLGGYNSGDFVLRGQLTQYLGSKGKNIGKLRLNILLQNKMPAWYFSHYSSNRFNWNQSLKKEKYLILSGTYSYKNVYAGVRLQTLNNYTYFNDSVVPAQNKTTGTIMQIFAGGTIAVHKVGLNFRGVYQKTTMANAIHLPPFTGMLDLYFKGWVFRHAGKLQSGIQLFYFSPFYANAYMPELRSFYLQNQTLTGNFVFMAPYVTLKVKSFRIFFKGSNLLGLLGNYHYYVSPHYPSSFPGFHLGISWRFHN